MPSDEVLEVASLPRRFNASMALVCRRRVCRPLSRLFAHGCVELSWAWRPCQLEADPVQLCDRLFVVNKALRIASENSERDLHRFRRLLVSGVLLRCNLRSISARSITGEVDVIGCPRPVSCCNTSPSAIANGSASGKVCLHYLPLTTNYEMTSQLSESLKLQVDARFLLFFDETNVLIPLPSTLDLN